MEPLVSIIMTTYNHAPYISQAIEAVLQQKVDFPYELVIGEDCSTDGTREIVFNYAGKHPDTIKIVTSEKNVGVKKNNWRTIDACRGKYLAFCEGDDYWHNPFKIQKQVDYLENHPECGLIFSDCNVYLNSANKLIENFNQYRGYETHRKISFEQILDREMVLWTCTAVTRKHLLRKLIDADPYLHKSEAFLMGDTQLWVEMTKIAEVVYIPDALATYRKLDESLSNSKDLIKTFRFWKSSSEMMLYLCNKYGVTDRLRKKYELSWCDSSLRLAFYSMDSELADEVKKKKALNYEEWLRYWGAKNAAVNYFCRFGKSLLNMGKKKPGYWER